MTHIRSDVLKDLNWSSRNEKKKVKNLSFIICYSLVNKMATILFATLYLSIWNVGDFRCLKYELQIEVTSTMTITYFFSPRDFLSTNIFQCRRNPIIIKKVDN